MRILVYPHDLGLGGSQINAIECAGAVRDLGHEVVVFGQTGPLRQMVDRLGLPFVESPPLHRRPTPSVVRAVARTGRVSGIQIIHGSEWPPVLECYLAARMNRRAQTIGTVMSMSVAPFIPSTVPLLVGTRQIAAAERSAGREDVVGAEPPVDVAGNDCSRDDLGVVAFRRRWQIDENATKIVVVSRLAHEMKLEGILSAIATVGRMAGRLHMQLVIVGDGPAGNVVREAARDANGAAGRRVVVTTGALRDPRPAYATADICLGMGSSVLRGMAFGKPAVVQGEQGFWCLLTPESVEQFLWTGWFGVGSGQRQGESVLESTLARLTEDRSLRDRLGLFGRQLVVDRFSLASAAQAHCEVYRQTRLGAGGLAASACTDAASACRFASYALRRAISRLRGDLASEDFNATPVAVAGPSGMAPAR